MSFVYAIWDIIRELSAWLLLGAFIGGLLHVLVPSDFIKKHLGGNNWWSVIKAAFIGVPMPLCSCSVIPTGIGLKKDGASNGAAISFLISTPQTGVDSITVAAGFLGWPFAIFKVLSAFIMGIIGGQLVNLFAHNNEPPGKKTETDTKTETEPRSCCAPKPAEEIKSCCAPKPAAAVISEQKSCCAPQESAAEPLASCCGPENAPNASSKFKQALDFAVNDLLRMIWLWLVIGIILSAGLNYFIDPGSLSDFAWATYFM